MVKKVVVEEPPPVCALSKKEAKKVEKIRSRIEYHKCRVSNFKGPCPDKAEQLASVARLEKEMAEIELVHSLLRGSPLELRRCPDFGWGLFATKRIWLHDHVLREAPLFDFTVADSDFTSRYVDAAAGTHLAGRLQSHEHGVMQMVQNAIDANEWPPSQSTNLLGLGWMADDAGRPISNDLSDDFEEQTVRAGIVGRMFDLPDDAWGVDEYALLRSKKKTNGLDQCLYVAVSKFNHSCEPNVAWDPWNRRDSLVATRPIDQGEQAFIAYAQGPNRKDAFKQQWGFECKCTRCQADFDIPPPSSEANPPPFKRRSIQRI
ncbi:hypothetical protein M885DRAFT_611496 [Pelagophyceae sp. CCMP2097]|nr:hypothetical protein M885DRAFT_611496 [Pelagophyceae sp. CCMP2097]